MFKIKKCKKGMEKGSRFFVKNYNDNKYFKFPMHGMTRNIKNAHPYTINDIWNYVDIGNLKKGNLGLVHPFTEKNLSKKEIIEILK